MLADVMKKRKRDAHQIESKIKQKELLKSQRQKKETVKAPEKFIKRYRAAQKSFVDVKKRVQII